MRTPEQVIGAEHVKALHLAGYEIVAREVPKRVQFTCPHCGAKHGAGEKADIFLNWGEAWHRPCVPWHQTAPSKRGDRRPMVAEMIST